MANNFLFAEELAERWDVSIGTLANWRYKNIGPKYDKAAPHWGRVKYRMKDIIAFERTSQRRPIRRNSCRPSR